MQEFIAYSENAKNALKAAQLVRNLDVNTLIIGASGVGKKALALQMAETLIIDAKNRDLLSKMLNSHQELIIDNFDAILDLSELELSKKKIVALSKKELSKEIIDKFFAVVIRLDELKDRKEDIKPLINHFIKEAALNLGIEPREIDEKRVDISNNIHSLKRSIYFELFKKSLTQSQIEEILENFFSSRLDEIDLYEKLLPIFERPLLKKGLEIYKSQLKLSEILGLNRNTIRKKLKECGL